MKIIIKKYASALFENELFMFEVSIKNLTINYEEYFDHLPKKNKDHLITADEIHDALVSLQSMCIMQTRDRFVRSNDINDLKNSMNVNIDIDLPYSGKAILVCNFFTNKKYQNSESGAFGEFFKQEGREPDVMNFDESLSEYSEPDIQIHEESIEEE